MKKLAWVLLLAFAFTVPWEYSLDLGEPLGNIARFVGLLLLLAAVPAAVQSRRLRTPGAVQWLVLAFYLWTCCTCLWTIDQPATFARMRGNLQEMMVVWLVWELAETPEHMRALLQAFVAGSWVLAILTVANFFSFDAADQVRFVAAGQDPNDVARFLDLGLPLAALLLDAEESLLGRLLAMGYLPLASAAVILTASRGGFLAALVGLAGCALLLMRNHARGAVAAVFALPALAAAAWLIVPYETLARLATIPGQVRGGDLNQRWNIWAAGWHAFAHAPFFGSGAGSFVAAAGLNPIDTAHNTALALVVEGGVVSLLLASVILGAALMALASTHGSIRTGMGAALCVWMVTSLVSTVHESRSTWLLLALVVLAGRLARENPAGLDRLFSIGLRRGARAATRAAAAGPGESVA